MAEGYLILTEQVRPSEDGGFEAYCPELRIASQGDDIDEAFNNIREAIGVYLESLDEMGGLDKKLAELGLESLPHEPKGPTKIELSRGEIVSSLIAVLPSGKLVA
jgi:predicted RNase H-like HicB family nuclease